MIDYILYLYNKFCCNREINRLNKDPLKNKDRILLCKALAWKDYKLFCK